MFRANVRPKFIRRRHFAQKVLSGNPKYADSAAFFLTVTTHIRLCRQFADVRQLKITRDDDARTRREKVNGKVLTLERSLGGRRTAVPTSGCV